MIWIACSHCYCCFPLEVTQCICSLYLNYVSTPSSVFMLEVRTVLILSYSLLFKRAGTSESVRIFGPLSPKQNFHTQNFQGLSLYSKMWVTDFTLLQKQRRMPKGDVYSVLLFSCAEYFSMTKVAIQIRLMPKRKQPFIVFAWKRTRSFTTFRRGAWSASTWSSTGGEPHCMRDRWRKLMLGLQMRFVCSLF